MNEALLARYDASLRGLARKDRLRFFNRWWFDFDVALVARGKHIAAPGVDPGGDGRGAVNGPRERVESRDSEQRLPRRERQPLHRGNADPQARKRSRPGRHRIQIDVAQCEPSLFEDHHQIARKTRLVRAIRIAAPFADDDPVARNRTAPAGRRRVQSQTEH